jgi:hypothetical protein
VSYSHLGNGLEVGAPIDGGDDGLVDEVVPVGRVEDLVPVLSLGKYMVGG